MPDAHLQVDQAALKGIMKALKAADPALQKELKVQLKKAAGIVATAAKGKVPKTSRRGANRSGSGMHAASSIGSGGNAKGAFVKGGSSSVPYYGWLDFGTRSPISGRPRSIGPWAGTGPGPKKGRFLYPAFEEKRDDVQAAVKAAVSKSIDSLF